MKSTDAVRLWPARSATAWMILGVAFVPVGCSSEEGEGESLPGEPSSSLSGPVLAPADSSGAPTSESPQTGPSGDPSTPPNPEAGNAGSGGGLSEPAGSGGGGGVNTAGAGGEPGPVAGGAGGLPIVAGSGGEAGASGGGLGGMSSQGDDDPVAAGERFDVTVELASDVDPAAPGTIGIVRWSLSDAEVSEATIEFGLDESYGREAPVDLDETDGRTLLLGMKPAQTYHFRILAREGTTTYQSDDYTIETGPPTTQTALESFNIIDDSTRERGFIVASYWRGENSSVVFILDADGEIVWWYDTGANGIARARMSADGKDMWMIVPDNGGGPLMRVSMDTLEGETYAATTGSHDLTPVSGATMAFIDYGESDCDSIFEIDPSGTTTEVFESEDVVGGMQGCHGNALRYSANEDVYTFSDVSIDVFVINRQGAVEWSLAERVEGGVAAWGGRQHGHHLLDNSMVVFANGGGEGNASVVIEYDFEGNELFRYDSGEVSQNLGDVQRLPGGNTFVVYSNSGIAHEVDPDGNLVLEITSGGSSMGYLLWRESLYGRPPDLDL